MRVLFTGATGVIGRAAVSTLVAAGHDVRALARTEAKVLPSFTGWTSTDTGPGLPGRR